MPKKATSYTVDIDLGSAVDVAKLADTLAELGTIERERRALAARQSKALVNLARRLRALRPRTRAR